MNARLDERALDVLAVGLAAIFAVALVVLAPRRPRCLALLLGRMALDGLARFCFTECAEVVGGLAKPDRCCFPCRSRNWLQELEQELERSP